MRSRLRLCLGALVLSFLPPAPAVQAADSPARKPLTSDERSALMSLLKAVDLAQETDVVSDANLPWAPHVLKAGNEVGYIPFRLSLSPLPDSVKSAAMYVRVVSRHDGYRSTEEDSSIREWILHGGALPARPPETMTIGAGEMPIGGPAVSSGRRSISAPAEASAVLAMQQRQFEKEKAAAEAAKKRAESKQRDPYVFPFEEYYFFDVNSRVVERAIGVPAGEYDVFIGIIDRARAKTSSPTIVRHTINVPDFWNLELRLSSLMLVTGVRTLPSALTAKDQVEHPYTFGRAEVTPVGKPIFSTDDVLSVVYQICNYGSPDTDITADYNFYRTVNGTRTLFNRTLPQQLTDGDLPPPIAWETQGFAMQRVPLHQFPSGEYELEVVVHDRLTRSTAKETTTFTVK
jgi:hypothetical protein